MQYGHILTYVYLYLTLQHCSQFLLKTSLNIRYLLLLSVNFHVNFLIVPSPEPHSPLSKDTVSLDLLENMTVSQNTSGLSTISPNQTFLRFILAGLRSGFLLAVLPLQPYLRRYLTAFLTLTLSCAGMSESLQRGLSTRCF